MPPDELLCSQLLASFVRLLFGYAKLVCSGVSGGGEKKNNPKTCRLPNITVRATQNSKLSDEWLSSELKLIKKLHKMKVVAGQMIILCKFVTMSTFIHSYENMNIITLSSLS